MKKFLIEDWKDIYKKLSFWALFIIYWSPEIFQQLVSYNLLDGFLPQSFISMIKLLAVGGVFSRIVKQNYKENTNESDKPN